jgi:hypothetical protein
LPVPVCQDAFAAVLVEGGYVTESEATDRGKLALVAAKIITEYVEIRARHRTF